MKLSSYKNWKERNKALENELEISLDNVNKSFIDEVDKVHCENLIGAITVPLCAAGPAKIIGKSINGNYYVPLSTTEGALVASISRGFKATSEFGIKTTIEKIGATRGPVLKFNNIQDAKNGANWINDNFLFLKTIAEKTSKHLILLDYFLKQVGKYLFIRFEYDTDKAMGMNMVTIATQKIIENLGEKLNFSMSSVAGNFDVDKKASWLNSINGRGFIVNAEVTLSKEIVSTVLKTTPKKIYDIWISKTMIGSAMSGSMSYNAHFANIVAAFFLATGQDIAHVVDGSLGLTYAELEEDGSLYFSINMPDIMLGILGGGTNLITQKEAKSILKVDNSEGLAEILAATVLAGELSLHASLAEGSLASAHEKLGR